MKTTATGSPKRARRQRRTDPALRLAWSATSASHSWPRQDVVTTTRCPSLRCTRAHRVAVMRLPLHDPAGAGVTVQNFTGPG